MRAMLNGRPVSAVLLVGLISGCTAAVGWKRAPHDRFFQREPAPRQHGPLAQREVSSWWELGWHSARPLGEVVSPAHQLRRLGGGAVALDVNWHGQVPDSTWFTNRINRRPMSAVEVARGQAARPLPAGPLVVVSGKLEGTTPGLILRDVQGTRWLAKFDHPAFPEMASGAEVIVAKLLYAAGYNVPDNRVEVLALSRLRLDPRAKTVDDYNRVVPLTAAELSRLLAQLNPRPDGTIRALLSREIEGQPMGPFSFQSTRPADPNDRLPHERRRSLRGLWVFAAWLNHTDSGQHNTYDTYIAKEDVDGRRRGFVRHYLIDFGSALGSGGIDAKPVTGGYAYYIDWQTMVPRLLALGAYYPYWLGVLKSPYRAIGVFEADVFRPTRWRPDYPNPAFQQATRLDTYWAASILARFRPGHLHAVVTAARYSEPGAAATVVRVLRQRQKKLLQHAFTPVLPLDRPRVVRQSELVLDDLAVIAGLREEGGCYRWQARWNRLGSGQDDHELGAGRSSRPAVDLSSVIERARRQEGFSADPYVTVSWWHAAAADSCALGPRVEVHLRVVEEKEKRLLVVGLHRETK